MLSSLSRRRVVVLLILTSLLLITLDRRGNNVVIDKARQAFSVIIRPCDIAANAVSKPIANAWYGITHYDDVKTENEALHDLIEHQKGAEIEYVVGHIRRVIEDEVVPTSDALGR